MSKLKPYETHQLGKLFYIFSTDNSIGYEVEFVNDRINFDESLSVFEITIATVETKNQILPPLDPRVELTVIEILRAFFSDNKNSTVFVCDNRDNRHHSRKRKFDSWYNKYRTPDIEKHDSDFKFDGIDFLTTLLINQNNPLKKIIIDLFLSQKNQVDK